VPGVADAGETIGADGLWGPGGYGPGLDGHFLRKIDKQIDWRPFEKVFEPLYHPNLGRPSHAPLVMLSIAPGSFAPTDPENGESSLGRTVRTVPGHVFRGGTPFHCPEKLLRALLLQVFIHHPERTALDGAVGLQSPVSLVRGSVHGRQGLGPFRLL
jgi:hypothetical protein